MINEIEAIKTKLNDLLESNFKQYKCSLYIIGSVAYNDYIHGTSDLDLIVIFEKELNSSLYDDIKVFVSNLKSALTNIKCDILFISKAQIGKDKSEKVIYYNNGVLNYDNNCGNMTPVTWYELKTIGVNIAGKNYSNNIITSLEDVKAHSYNNINTYWTEYIDKLRKMELTSEILVWCVLGISRIMYLIKENKICSKTEAGLYVYEQAKSEYRNIIKKALDLRRGNNVVITCEDKILVLKYMLEVVNEVNRIYIKTSY